MVFYYKADTPYIIICVCERTACKQGINKYYTLINILPSRGFRNCIKIKMKKNEKV